MESLKLLIENQQGLTHGNCPIGQNIIKNAEREGRHQLESKKQETLPNFFPSLPQAKSQAAK